MMLPDVGFSDFSMPDLGPGSSALQYATMAPDVVGNLGADLGKFDFSGALSGGGLGLGSTGSMTAPGVSEGVSAGAPGGGFLDTIGKYAKPVSGILGGLTSMAQIPLAVAGLNVARRGQKALEQGAQTAQQAAAPQIAAEQALLPAGTNAMLTGQLPPQLQAQVDLQVNQAKQALLQNLANSGIDPTTAEAMIQSQLEQLRTQLTTQYAQSLLSGGAGMAGGGFSAAQGGQLGGQEMTAANQALSGANQAMNRLLASAG